MKLVLSSKYQNIYHFSLVDLDASIISNRYIIKRLINFFKIVVYFNLKGTQEDLDSRRQKWKRGKGTQLPVLLQHMHSKQASLQYALGFFFS